MQARCLALLTVSSLIAAIPAGPSPPAHPTTVRAGASEAIERSAQDEGSPGAGPLAVFEPFIGAWREETTPDATFANYRLYEWALGGAIVRFCEYPHPDRRWRVASIIGWNPVEREIQAQEHADWGNLVRIRYEPTAGGVDRHMTVFNSNDGRVHRWVSSWRLVDADTLQASAREIDEDGEVIQEWPVATYRRVAAVPSTVIAPPRKPGGDRP